MNTDRYTMMLHHQVHRCIYASIYLMSYCIHLSGAPNGETLPPGVREKLIRLAETRYTPDCLYGREYRQHIYLCKTSYLTP